MSNNMKEVSRFKPLRSHQELIGPRIRGSKKRFDWEFELEGRRYAVTLECSFLTNKRRVYVDKVKHFEGYKQFGEQFRYTLESDKHVIIIENEGSTADLIIDNLSFKHEYTLRTLNIKPHSYHEPQQKETRDLYLKKLWENSKLQDENPQPKVGELLKDTDSAPVLSGLLDLDQPKYLNAEPVDYDIELEPVRKPASNLAPRPIPSDFLEIDHSAEPSAPRLTNDYDLLEVRNEAAPSSDLLNLEGPSGLYPSLPSNPLEPNQDIFNSNLKLQTNPTNSEARKKQNRDFEVLFS